MLKAEVIFFKTICPLMNFYLKTISSPYEEINREKEIVIVNLRAFKEYPGSNLVRMYDDDDYAGNFEDFPFFETMGRDELGTTYGLGEFGGLKYPAFIVTDPDKHIG